jgi:intraflagellar transport protein 80
MNRWSGDGDFVGSVKLAIFDTPEQQTKQTPSNNTPPANVYVTDMQWVPLTPGKGQVASDSYIAGATDGKFYMCSKTGRVEKTVDAHKGAVLAVSWNYEGSALATGS